MRTAVCGTRRREFRRIRLPAFARAAEQGYAIELDIQITKDGRIVVFHDGHDEADVWKRGKNQRLYV